MSLPSERTPLLVRQSSSPLQQLPCIENIEKNVGSSENGQLPYSPQLIIQYIQDHSSDLPSGVASLSLIIIVCLRCLSRAELDDETRRTEMEAFVKEKWKELKASDIETVHVALWMPFPLYDEDEVTTNVVQTMQTAETMCHIALLNDKVTTFSLFTVWKQGLPKALEAMQYHTSYASHERLRTIAPPRVMHLAELTVHAIYLLVFSGYIMQPPLSYGEELRSFDSRPVCLLGYSASIMIKELWKTPIAFVLTFFSLLTFIPYGPGANDFPYFATLLTAFGLHIIQLLIPHRPSPSFVIPATFSLPLSVMIAYLIDTILTPAFIFFIPVFIISVFLLASSLSDLTLFENIRTSPVSTRDAMLMLLLVLAILFLGLITAMTLQTPNIHSKSIRPLGSGAPRMWDIYGSNIGLAVRQAFFRTVSSYSHSFFFPAPLNILQFAIVSVPYVLMTLVGHKRRAIHLRNVLNRVLWTILVIPLVAPFGVFWLWGLI